MKQPHLRVVEDLVLPFLLSVPKTEDLQDERPEPRPVLCFLHGLMEGPPTELRAGLTAHGPLRAGSSPLATGRFIVAAPQLPARGDIWRSYADVVINIVDYIYETYGGDRRRTYLTGFSFGGNGVFDLALIAPGRWAALWPVDPTRVPEADPGVPVWLSAGEAARHNGAGFIDRLGLKAVGPEPGDRVYVDEGLDHVGTATSAYRNDAIYHWLLSKRLK